MGLLMLLLVKEVMKLLTKHVLMQLCKLTGIACVYHKRLSQVTYLKVHYSSSFITLDEVGNLL